MLSGGQVPQCRRPADIIQVSFVLAFMCVFPFSYPLFIHVSSNIRMNNYVPILERLGWLVFDWAWPSRKSLLYS